MGTKGERTNFKENRLSVNTIRYAAEGHEFINDEFSRIGLTATLGEGDSVEEKQRKLEERLAKADVN